MPQPFELVVGLGNPGPDYSNTRHNAGFWCIDSLAADCSASFRPEKKFFGDVCRINVHGHECWLLKPMTYMNDSGRAVQAMMSFYKISLSQILVIHDEIDLPPGSIRFKTGGGHGGHNGLRDIISATGGNDFSRIRIGVGHPGHRDEVVSYVLSRVGQDQETLIRDAIQRALQLLPDIIQGKTQKAMNVLHKDPANNKQEEPENKEQE